jgi:methionyl-tRNA formyltransferase
VSKTLQALWHGEITPVAQDPSKATFAPPLTKQDGRIDWARPPEEIYNQIRGVQPWPRAFTLFRRKTCGIWAKPLSPPQIHAASGRELVSGEPGSKAAPPGTIELVPPMVLVRCGEGGGLRLEFVQIEGRKRITAQEFANGERLTPGERFGT